MTRSRLALLACGLLPVTVLAGCGDDGSDEGGGSDGRVLTVLAAASLTETFTELETTFEAEHEGVDVRVTFDSSATLASQAVEGAPADVLATADTITMGDAVDGGAVGGEPEVFATNVATLVVPADNPAGIESFADLDSGDVTYVVCVPDAPCGNVARILLDDAGIEQEPASEQVDVKSVLQQVTEGQADAGIVYVSDAVAAGDAVTSVEIPDADAETLEYPIAVLEQSEEPDLAQEWIDLVATGAGQDVLAAAGFGPPTP